MTAYLYRWRASAWKRPATPAGCCSSAATRAGSGLGPLQVPLQQTLVNRTNRKKKKKKNQSWHHCLHESHTLHAAQLAWRQSHQAHLIITSVGGTSAFNSSEGHWIVTSNKRYQFSHIHRLMATPTTYWIRELTLITTSTHLAFRARQTVVGGTWWLNW